MGKQWVFCSKARPAGFYPDNSAAMKQEVADKYVKLFDVGSPEMTVVDNISTFNLLCLMLSLIIIL
jgi:hypothetical protein